MRRTIFAAAVGAVAAGASAQSSAIFSVHYDAGPEVLPGTVLEGRVQVSWSAPSQSSNFVGVGAGSFVLRFAESSPGALPMVLGPLGPSAEGGADITLGGDPGDPDPGWTVGRRPAMLVDGEVVGGFRYPPNGTGPTDIDYRLMDAGHTLTGVNGEGEDVGIEFAQFPRSIIGAAFVRSPGGFNLFRFRLVVPDAPGSTFTVTPEVAFVHYYSNSFGGNFPFGTITEVGAVVSIVPAVGVAPAMVMGIGLVRSRRRR